MSRHRYPIEFCRVFKRSTSSKLKEAIAASYEQGEDEEVEAKEDGSNVLDTSKTKKNAKKGGKIPDANKTGNDGTRSKKCTLKMVIGEGLGYGPQLSEHMILDAGLTPSMKISKDNKLDEGKVEVLGQAVGRFEDWLEDVILGSKVPEGYILMQTKKPGGKDSGTTVPDHSSKVVILQFLPFEWFADVLDSSIDMNNLLIFICHVKDIYHLVSCTNYLDASFTSLLVLYLQIYDEYCPILLYQFKSRDLLKFETFDAALDEFYSKIESQRVEQQQKAKEGSAMQKLDKIRMDQVCITFAKNAL